MSLVLTITTGRIARERTEAFQVTFRALLSRRFEEASFDNDVPLTVRIFRDFGAEPEIILADVSSFLQPVPGRPPMAGERTIEQRQDYEGREGSDFGTTRS